MEWNNAEQENTKKGMNLSSKILVGIIVCIILIIILLFILILNMNNNTTTFGIYVDGKKVDISKEALLSTSENTTYINIEEVSKLVGYEYHEGEYKAYIVDKEKCYVEGKKETASFYLNDNKVYKLPVNEREDEYQIYEFNNTVKIINEKMYAPLDIVAKAFNVVFEEKNNYFQIYTLDYLVSAYDAKVKEWGYTGIADQSFENHKALLSGYLIVKKEGGLYKIINNDNTKEIVLDRYSAIEFSEYMQEFYVTNGSSRKDGVINIDGTTKIETNYEEVSVLDKEADLYLIKQNQKYGVVKGGNTTIIFPEYDKIGINDKKLILDTLIPVYKDEKWGAYDKNGKLVLGLLYDGFGYNSTSIEIEGNKKSVQPVLEIAIANGIVVEQNEKYGLLSLSGKELVPIRVEGIYAIKGIEEENKKYFMYYIEEDKGKELNVIERLIIAGLLEDTSKKDENIEDNTNTIN